MGPKNSVLARSLTVLIAVSVICATAFALPAPAGPPAVSPYAPPPAHLSFNMRRALPYAVLAHATALGASADKSFQYGVDADGVPFARKADGTKGRFVNMSPHHAKLQLSRGGQLGEVEFTRLSGDKTMTRFKTAAGDRFLVFATKNQAGKDGPTGINLLFSYNDEKVSLSVDDIGAQKGFSRGAEKRLRAMLTRVSKSRGLAELMGSAQTFTDKSVLAGVNSAALYSFAFADSLECIIAAAECIMTIAAYVGSIAALIKLCPVTVGAGCLGALLLHPVISVLVAAKCADATRKCGIAPPTPPTKPQYQQACLDFGGSWDSFAEECISIPIVYDPTPGTCRGMTDFVSYATSGCITGLIYGYSCNRSSEFRSRCDDYDDWNCVCIGGMSMSPIVIDVDRGGFSMTDAAGGVVFDILNDGVPLPISWTAAGSTNAFLVLDRNGNGTIDSGAELFGNVTPQPVSSAAANGFIALAEYDKQPNGGNGNGRIDSADSVFTQLRLWQDVNHNGASEPNELHMLPALGVKALGLDFKESKKTDQHGNKFRYRAKVYDADGAHTGKWAWDVFFTMK